MMSLKKKYFKDKLRGIGCMDCLSFAQFCNNYLDLGFNARGVKREALNTSNPIQIKDKQPKGNLKMANLN